MIKQIGTKNNYSAFKDEFIADTKLDPNVNVSEYINYYNARINDKAYQTNIQLAEILLNAITPLPDTIRLRIAEMISSHAVIKEAMQLLRK